MMAILTFNELVFLEIWRILKVNSFPRYPISGRFSSTTVKSSRADLYPSPKMNVHWLKNVPFWTISRQFSISIQPAFTCSNWRRSGVFIVNFEHVIAGWDILPKDVRKSSEIFWYFQGESNRTLAWNGLNMVRLTHYRPVLLFYSPWRFSDENNAGL